ncbi:MAG: hypothetical protein IJ461_04235 [Clostridia bacterium]|nr:hypothetical protein [Clostridia bacterium]
MFYIKIKQAIDGAAPAHALAETRLPRMLKAQRAGLTSLFAAIHRGSYTSGLGRDQNFTSQIMAAKALKNKRE